MPHTDNVEGFLEKLGDFYEMIDDRSPSQKMKRESPRRELPVKNVDVTNGVKSSTDSSSETSDTSHTHSDLSSHSVVGMYLNPLNPTRLETGLTETHIYPKGRYTGPHTYIPSLPCRPVYRPIL